MRSGCSGCSETEAANLPQALNTAARTGIVGVVLEEIQQCPCHRSAATRHGNGRHQRFSMARGLGFSGYSPDRHGRRQGRRAVAGARGSGTWRDRYAGNLPVEPHRSSVLLGRMRRSSDRRRAGVRTRRRPARLASTHPSPLSASHPGPFTRRTIVPCGAPPIEPEWSSSARVTSSAWLLLNAERFREPLRLPSDACSGNAAVRTVADDELLPAQRSRGLQCRGHDPGPGSGASQSGGDDAAVLLVGVDLGTRRRSGVLAGNVTRTAGDAADGRRRADREQRPRTGPSGTGRIFSIAGLAGIGPDGAIWVHYGANIGAAGGQLSIQSADRNLAGGDASRR